MATGDHCAITGSEGARTVTHYDCDMFANGTVTDVRTGQVVQR